jgi:hypothetical protein
MQNMPSLEAGTNRALLFGVLPAWHDGPYGLPQPALNPARAQRIVQMLMAGGVRIVKIYLRWSDVEPSRGRLDWRLPDSLVRAASDAKCSVLMTVVGTPEWALDPKASGPGALPAGAYQADLAKFARLAAARWKSRVRHWEFWELPSYTEHYVECLRTFSNAVKSIDPLNEVAAAATTAPVAGIRLLAARGASAFVDAVAAHPAFGRDFVDVTPLDNIFNQLAARGLTAKSVWVTRWGWETDRGGAAELSEGHQARLIREGITALQSRSFIGLAVYDSLNDFRTVADDPTSLTARGLVDARLNVRPGFAAFRELSVPAPLAPAPVVVRSKWMGELPAREVPGLRSREVVVRLNTERTGGQFPNIAAGMAVQENPRTAELLDSVGTALKSAGMKMVRVEPFALPDAVSSTETPQLPFQPERVQWAVPDAQMEACRRAGVRPFISIGAVPSALAAAAGTARTPRSMEEWGGFIRAAVERYQTRFNVAAWEFNADAVAGAAEPDIVRMFAQFSKSVTQASPEARVAGPGFARLDPERMASFAGAVIAAGAVWHIATWRSFRFTPSDVERQVRAVRMSVGEKMELLITEAGLELNGAKGHIGLQAASWVLSVLEQTAEHPVGVLFYSLKDPAAAAQQSTQWGAFTADGKPRPLWHALWMAGQLKGRSLPVESEETGIRVMAAKDGAAARALIWSYPPGPAEYPAATEAPDRSVALRVEGLTSASGSTAKIYLLTSSEAGGLPPPITLHLPPGPPEIPITLPEWGAALVEITPASALPLEMELQPEKHVVWRGGRASLTAVFRNNLNASRQLVCRLESDRQGVVSPAEARPFRVTVPPRGSISVPITWTAPASVPSGALLLRLSTTGAAATASLRIAAPLTVTSRSVDAQAGVNGKLPPVTLRLTVQNRSDEPQKVQLAHGTQKTTKTVPPLRELDIPLTIAVPSGDPGLYPVPIQVSANGSEPQVVMANVRVPFSCVELKGAFRANGDLTEWRDAVSMVLVPTARGRRGGMGGTVSTMWDAEHLYIAAVLPVEPVSEAGGSGMRLQIGVDGQQLAVALHGTPSLSIDGTTTEGAKVAVREAGERRIVELALPWSLLKRRTPPVGELLEFRPVLISLPGGTEHTAPLFDRPALRTVR